jgi:hypothetical protein
VEKRNKKKRNKGIPPHAETCEISVLFEQIGRSHLILIIDRDYRLARTHERTFTHTCVRLDARACEIYTYYTHHHQPINVPTAGVLAFLIDHT